VTLGELLDLEQLRHEIAHGYVTQRAHPYAHEQLLIYNYTAQCQHERRWNDVTRQCRGLIARVVEGEVVARPWPKFFNYGEHEEGALDLSAPARVTDKLDGSLGIYYPTIDGLGAIATRGSFTSEQAQEATRIWRGKRYGELLTRDDERTYTLLFEIIYPGNRVVVDYGDRHELVLLDVVETATGKRNGAYGWGWPGPKVEWMPADTLAEALALPPRPNAEGVVVDIDGGPLVKLKQEDYVALHRLITGLSERRVWEHLASEQPLSGLLLELPEEFRDWVCEIGEALENEFQIVWDRAHERFSVIVRTLHEGSFPRGYRAAFAELAKAEGDLTHHLFTLLDGHDPGPAIWRELKPQGSRRMLDHGEDIA
jgi:RNA ligase